MGNATAAPLLSFEQEGVEGLGRVVGQRIAFNRVIGLKLFAMAAARVVGRVDMRPDTWSAAISNSFRPIAWLNGIRCSKTWRRPSTNSGSNGRGGAAVCLLMLVS